MAVERLLVGQPVLRIGQAKAETMGEVGARRMAEHAHELVAGPVGSCRRGGPGQWRCKPRRCRALRTSECRGVCPARLIREAARVAAFTHVAADGSDGERLQRMRDDEAFSRSSGRREILRGDIEQFRHHHRRRQGFAAAWIATEIAHVENLGGRGEQLQEQAAVVVAHRAVAHLPMRPRQLGRQSIQAARRIASREFAVIHSQQANDLERHQAHRHHSAEGDAAGEERLAAVAFGQRRGEPRTHDRRGHLVGHARLRCLPGEGRHLRTQAIDGVAIGVVARALRKEVGNQCTQRRRPVAGRTGEGQCALPMREPAQRLQQAVEHQQVAAFQQGKRRDAGDHRFIAGGMAEQQAIERPGPTEGSLGRRIELSAMFGIQAPARASRAQPMAKRIEIRGLQFEALGDGGYRQQVEHVVDREARIGQVQQSRKRLGHGVARDAAAVAQRIGNDRARAGLAGKHGLYERRVRIDVRGKHGNLARLQLWIAFEQFAQLVVQHLHLAQPRVAGMHLQAAIGQCRGIEGRLRCRIGRWCASRQQVALQPMQQAGADCRIRRHVQGKVPVGVHHFVGKKRAHEIAPGRAIGAQQRIFPVVEHGLGIRLQAFARADQVAPPAGHRRQEEKVQCAGTRTGGDDPQHVG